MDLLLGLTSVLFTCLFYLIVGIRWPGVAKILFVALAARIFLLIISFFITLPDSSADSQAFEIVAWRDLAKFGITYVFDSYKLPGVNFYSYVIAVPYSLFGRSALMIQSISLFFGMGVVFLSWLFAKKLFSDHVAIKVGWTVALFPTMILYSVLIMREIFICFFFLVAIFSVVNWVRTKNFVSFILVIFGFMVATLFHGGMIAGLMIFIVIFTFYNLKLFFKLIFNNRIRLFNLMFIILGLFAFYMYFSNNISIPKIGTFEQILDLDTLSKKPFYEGASSSFPMWVKTSLSGTEFILKIPIRAIYFIFSPFPWEMSKIIHLVGVFDGFLYMIMTFLIFQNRQIIWKDPALRIIFLMLLAYIAIFAIGTENSGTAVRHRIKFFIVMLFLAAQSMPKIIPFEKK